MTIAASLPIPVLPIGCYRFIFEVKKSLHLPDYTGSLWRGAFGHALKSLVCVTHEANCSQCMLHQTCAYPYIFETPPDPAIGKLRKYTAAPHPFVIVPELTTQNYLAVGAELSIRINLFGRGNHYLPYIVHAMNQAGRRGLGRDRGMVELQQVEQSEPDGNNWRCILITGGRLIPSVPTMPMIPSCPKEFSIVLETPLRLKTDEHNVSVAQFSFAPFFSNLLRRISLLTTFHTDIPLDTNFAGLTHYARWISPQDINLHWHDWERYSSRQQTRIPMGGLTGRIHFIGSMEPFWPYLWLGQWTHAGKGTSMGLGRYRIEISPQINK